MATLFATAEKRRAVEALTVKRNSLTSQLDRLYRENRDDALKLAYALTGNIGAAEDLVQEAFVRLFGRFTNRKEPDDFARYLRATIVNLARSRGRKLKNDENALQRLNNEIESSVLPDEIWDQRDVLWRALLQLPVRQRAVLYFRYYLDLSESQTAEAMGWSVGAVKSLTLRAKKKLRTTARRTI